jgi:hypothetical protein
MNKSINYKEFSSELYNVFSPLEEKVINKIKIENCSIEKNLNQYGIDLIIVKNGYVMGGIEVESHEKYWKNNFPFNTVHFLARKEKYKGYNNFYLMVSKGCCNALMINFMKLKDDYKIIQDNVLCYEEILYDVPVEKCIVGWDGINQHLSYVCNKDNQLDSWFGGE